MSDGKLTYLKTEDIITDKAQPRKSFDCYELSMLAESIRKNGIIHPLIVREKDDGGYKLISGERRLRAAGLIGLKRVPCIVRRVDEITAACLTLIENVNRCELTVFEEAEGINRLIDDYGVSLLEVAERLGTTRSALEGKLSLLELDDELRCSLTAARLSYKHARALLKICREDRKEALEYIIANQLTVSETEKYITDRLNPKKEPIRKCAIGDVRLFSNSLRKMVDTMRQGGISAEAKQNETETHIEYTVMIKK